MTFTFATSDRVTISTVDLARLREAASMNGCSKAVALLDAGGPIEMQSVSVVCGDEFIRALGSISAADLTPGLLRLQTAVAREFG